MSADGNTRRSVLIGAGVVTLGALVEGFLLQPRRLSVTRHRLGSPGSGADRPLRVVQLTDLHLEEVGPFQERVANRVHELQPDVLLLTGDSVDDSAGLPALAAFLEMLPSTAASFATIGNWEYWGEVELAALERIYERGGCRLLLNETGHVEHAGRVADIVGVDDLVAGTPDLVHAARSSSSRNVLVVSHCPAYRDRVDAQDTAGIVAMVSGHTHGGQLAVGRWSPFTPPGSGAYVSGWYRDGALDLYVSRGLGTSLVPFRLGSIPEIAVFDWHLSA